MAGYGSSFFDPKRMILDLKQDLKVGPLVPRWREPYPFFVGQILVFCSWSSNFGRFFSQSLLVKSPRRGNPKLYVLNPYFCWLIFTFCNTETSAPKRSQTETSSRPRARSPGRNPPSQPQKFSPTLPLSALSALSALGALGLLHTLHLYQGTPEISVPIHRTHIGSTRLLTSGCHQQKLLGFGVKKGFVPLRPYQSTENVVGQQTFGGFRHPNGF